MSNREHTIRVWIYTTSGKRIEVMDYTSVYAETLLSDIGNGTLVLFDDDIILQQISVGDRIRIYWNWLDRNARQVNVFDGIITGFRRLYTTKSVIVLLEHINRFTKAQIAYFEKTAQSNKNMAGDKAMTEYVNENIGQASNNVLRGKGDARANRTSLNLSVSTAIGNAPVWEGEKSYQSLLDTLNEIADTTQTEWMITSSSVRQYLFTAKHPFYGADRRNDIRLSECLGNVSFIEGVEDYTNRATLSYAIGSGEGENKLFSIKSTTDHLVIPELDIEVTADGNDQDTQNSIDTVAMTGLAENKGSFETEIELDENIIFGRDLYLGDIFTAREPYTNKTQDFEVVGTSISASGDDGIQLRIIYTIYPRIKNG